MEGHMRPVFGAIVALLMSTAIASAETLKLPDNLTGFDTETGEELLVQSDAREAYFPLASNFLTQKTQSYCGVASIVMVLNSLGVAAPAVPEFEPYRTFTQDNVLDEATDTVLPRATLAEIGMTLDQIGGILNQKGVKAVVHHAADSSIDDFRTSAREALGKKGSFVIVNYLRKAMGQEKGGHISPLAAYDVESDRFLILDVARYKYPPVWVTTADLFAAMKTTDSDNENKTRGFVLVTAQ
jgi:glutathione-S-conjugate glycine hydrolase